MDPNPTRPSFAHAGTTLTETLPTLEKNNASQTQGEKKSNDVENPERNTKSSKRALFVVELDTGSDLTLIYLQIILLFSSTLMVRRLGLQQVSYFFMKKRVQPY